MTTPPQLGDELHRQAALYALGLLDTEQEEEFDRIARLAQRLLSVPSALVSFMDHDRQWYKARVGVEAEEVERSETFCTHVVADGRPLIVEDARDDPRFADNPHVRADGGVRFYAGVPIHSPNGHSVGTLCVFDSEPRQVTEAEIDPLFDLAAMVDEIILARVAATIDELTGVQNRRGFMKAAEPLLRLADRAGVVMTLGYFDVNGLKPINDNLGHEAGDLAISEAAKLLTHCFRAADVVARMGGDEFAVLFASAGVDGAAVAFERLRSSVEKQNQTGRLPFDLNIAAGFVERQPNGLTLEEMLAQADAAMYRTKP